MRLLAAAAAAATGVQVGSAIVATRFVVDQPGPASLALLRYLIGALCLLPPVLLSTHAPGARLARRDLTPIGVLGSVQFGVLIALLSYGLRFVSSARAALQRRRLAGRRLHRHEQRDRLLPLALGARARLPQPA
jgi:drug/metabolite transporter (DMT)-like permease